MARDDDRDRVPIVGHADLQIRRGRRVLRMLAGCYLSQALDQSALVPPRPAHFRKVRSAESRELFGSLRKLDGIAPVTAATASSGA